MSEGMNRRRFLTVLGVTGGGAAALGACGVGAEPTKKLIPYLVQPEDQIPGTATSYATTCRECAAGCGVHAKVREGRVIKLEGNPESPINRGRLCAATGRAQGVYNPDRVTKPWPATPRRTREGLVGGRLGAPRGRSRRPRQEVVFVTGHEAGSFGDLVDDG
jgi:molybdopterin-containing oxidoreductase family iron-sulfur binding subunit